MIYDVLLTRQARNYYKHAPRDLALRIKDVLMLLSADPYAKFAKRLKGDLDGLLRIRIGHIRLVYNVEEEKQFIRVIYIGPRGDAY